MNRAGDTPPVRQVRGPVPKTSPVSCKNRGGIFRVPVIGPSPGTFGRLVHRCQKRLCPFGQKDRAFLINPTLHARDEGGGVIPLSFGIGGQGGIRTHETVSRPHAFQACAFSHSATCPSMRAGARILLLPPSGRGAFSHSATCPSMRVGARILLSPPSGRGAFRHAATCPLDQPGQGPGKGS